MTALCAVLFAGAVGCVMLAALGVLTGEIIAPGDRIKRREDAATFWIVAGAYIVIGLGSGMAAILIAHDVIGP